MRWPGRLALAVAAGSALGAAARYGLSLALLAGAGPAFPWGTLAVNALGSFLVGLYAALAGPSGRLAAGPVAGAFAITGFCGGFTTFSIFSLETLLLAAASEWERAVVFVLASVALWVLAVMVGHAFGRRLGRSLPTR